MKKLIILLALLVTASFSAAAFQGLPADVEKNLAAIGKYPKAGSILLWVKDGYTLNADGSKIYERHEFRYLPDEAARDAFGDPHVAYVSGRDTLQILTARSYTPDGRAIDATPHNAFNPIVPEGGLDQAPDYSDFRQMVVTLLGLENRCIAELHYRITTYQPLFPWLEGRVYFRDEAPVMARELQVTVPAGVKLTAVPDGGVGEPVVAGGSHTWTVGEQAPYLPEDLAHHRILLPNVAFTTAGGWGEIRAALNMRVDDATHEQLTLPASLQKRLVGVSGEEAKLDTVKAWVRERFNRLEFHEHPDFALVLRPVTRILESGYGNDFETALLVAKLANAGRRGGVYPLPVFVPEPPVASLHEWAPPLLRTSALHPISAAFTDPVEPATEFSATDLLDYWALNLFTKSARDGEAADPGIESFRQQWAEHAERALRLTLVLDNPAADTLRGHGTLTAHGPCGVFEAVRANGPAEYLAGLVTLNGIDISRATVRELTQSAHAQTVGIDFAFTAARLDTADDALVLPLALMDFKALTPDAPWGLATREFRQDISGPGSLALRVETPLPAGYTVAAEPKGQSRRWDFDDTGNVQCEVTDGRLVFERQLILTKDWVSASKWPDYRAFVLESGPNARNAVIFAPAKNTAAK